jgi:hypothetical protein
MPPGLVGVIVRATGESALVCEVKVKIRLTMPAETFPFKLEILTALCLRRVGVPA